MRILVATQYFCPENFRINDLAQGLPNRGHVVTASSRPVSRDPVTRDPAMR
jgi:hypothetical protein